MKHNWYATSKGPAQQLLVVDAHTGNTDERRARLIAAAPAMLRALKRLNDNWDLLPRDLQQVVVEAVEEAEDYETV